MAPEPTDSPYLPTEREVITPVQSINGTLLYQRTTERELIKPVGAKGQPLVVKSAAPLVITVDEVTGKTTTAARTDGVKRHLLRQLSKPVTEPPTGYYVLESASVGTRAKVIRDADGKLVGLETEHAITPKEGEPAPNRWGAKQQPGFGAS